MTTPIVSGEPRLAAAASWAVLAASFGLSASTWIALAVLAGFTGTITAFGATLALAWLMPVAVDGYVVVALVLWMAPVPAKVAAFARINTYAAAGIGVAAQSAYHALSVWSAQSEAWRAVLAAIVGALPPAVAGLAVHMRALIRREGRNTIPPAEPSTNPPSPVDNTAAGSGTDPRPEPAKRQPEPAGQAPTPSVKPIPVPARRDELAPEPAVTTGAMLPPPITTPVMPPAPPARVNGHAVGSGVVR